MEFPSIGNSLGIDIAGLAEQARRQTLQAMELRERTAKLIGRAKSHDGRVTVGFSATQGLPELVIDPRAMRMGSEDLADLIRDLVNQAMQDLESQKQQTAREVLGDDFDPDALQPNAKAMEEALQGMTETVESAGQNVTALMEQMRRRLGR